MALRSSGSSASAARRNRSSSNSTIFTKLSRKIPDRFTSTSMRGWPSGLQGPQVVAHDPPGALLHRFGPHQLQQDRQGFAAGLDGIEAPEHHRHGFGPGAAVLGPVLLQDPQGDGAAPGHRPRRGHPVGIQGVDVAAGGQHAGAVAQQVAAGGGGDVLAPQASSSWSISSVLRASSWLMRRASRMRAGTARSRRGRDGGDGAAPARWPPAGTSAHQRRGAGR